MRPIFALALVSVVCFVFTNTFAQTKQDISTQSTAAGSANAGRYSLVVSAAGQASPINESRVGRYVLFSGYLFTLDQAVANRPPALTAALANQTLVVGSLPFTRNLQDFFSDPDGDALSFSASSSNMLAVEVTIVDSTLEVAPVGIGSTTITITAFDGRGGFKATGLIVTVISGQISEPVIVEPPTLGASITLTINPPQNFQATLRQLFYRFGGEQNYRALDLAAAGNQLAAAIPAAPDSQMIRGIEYYISLSDGLVAVTFPAENARQNPAIIRVQVAQLDFQLSLQPRTHKMISVPLDLENPAIDAVLLDDYGRYNVLPRQWRIFRWENDAYTEHDDIVAQFIPGNSFWLITREAAVFDVENGLSANSAQPAIITLPLGPGWNQIANPFAFPVDWNGVAKSGLVEEPRFFIGDNQYVTQTILQPWEGYFVFNNEDFPVTLTFPAVETQNSPQTIAPPGFNLGRNDYVLKMAATIPGTKFTDNQNYLGIVENTVAGTDRFDYHEPPPIGDYLRLSILAENEAFAGNFKPLVDRGEKWDVELASTLPNPEITILLTESGKLPAGFEKFIFDQDFRTAVAINGDRFIARWTPEFPTRRFKIILGVKEFAEENADGISLVPLEFALEQNYPNPFNPETTIRYRLDKPGAVRLEIYNLLGQKVRTLLDQTQNAGEHLIKWDGQDDTGRAVSSGVYLYRLQSGESVATRKLALIR